MRRQESLVLRRMDLLISTANGVALEDFIGGGAHPVQGADDVLWNGAPQTCTVRLTGVTPIHSIRRKKIKDVNLL